MGKLKESINEANLLREELKENKDASKAVRSKVTETGASLISLKDKLNVSNGKILHLQDTIKDLQIESQNFKTHVSDAKEAYKLASQEKYLSAKEELKTMKEYLHDAEINIKSKSQELDYFKEKTKAIEKNAASAKDALITEKEMAVSKMKENLACIKTSLSRAEADTLFFKQEKDKYKNQLKILKNHSNSAKQGFNVEIEKNVDILQHKVDIFEENACKAIVEKEEYQNCIKVFQEKILILESKIIDLSNEKKIQETRIKRLEAKRLTKEQLAIIKTIKEERLHKAEAEAAGKIKGDKEKVESTPDRLKISNLRGKNDALEKKLRKYHAHCQHLETEKQDITELVKSNIQNNGNTYEIENDFAGGIITLCNRFSSLEEEYERLISADKKESTYQVELETQHMENEKLRKTISHVKESLSKSLKSEKDTTRELRQIKETVEKERINAADFEHEKKGK